MLWPPSHRTRFLHTHNHTHKSCYLIEHVAQRQPGFDLELGLIQTHMAQKPVLRVEVGALGARRVKDVEGGIGQAQWFKAPVWVCVGVFFPRWAV